MLDRNQVTTALEYMERNGLVRLVKPTGSWYQLYCPFHNNGQERKPSCGCSLDPSYANGTEYTPGTWHCFSCGVAYPFGKGIQEILNAKGHSIESYPELKQYIEGNIDQRSMNSLIPDSMVHAMVSKYALEDMRTRLMSKTTYVSEEELAKYRFTVPYMYQRRLTDAVIEKYDVGYDANHIPAGRKKALPCVTFPVRDVKGRTLFICRRSIEGKYFNLPSDISKSLYGIYELPSKVKEVIVCESIFNALTCVVYGYPAVALLGTGTSKEIEQLKRLGVSSYILCLDNDEAGRKGTERLKNALKNFGLVWTMTVPEGKDVNDLEYSEFIEVYNNRQ